jgi:hypothetical protein
MSSLEDHDDQQLRCVHLGGPVTFGYCRRVTDRLPCKLIIGCWHGRLDIIDFLRRHFTADQLRQALQPEPGSKLDQFIERVGRAQSAPATSDEEEERRQDEP